MLTSLGVLGSFIIKPLEWGGGGGGDTQLDLIGGGGHCVMTKMGK